jgi:hypothetical protein
MAIAPRSLSFKSFFGGTKGAMLGPKSLVISDPPGNKQDPYIGSISINPPFSIPQGVCSGFLSQPCKVPVTFTPSSFESQHGSLNIVGSNVQNIPIVAISGIGSKGTIAITPKTHKFDRVPVATPSNMQVKLTNPNPADLDLYPPNVSPSRFQIVGNTCGTSLASGASCSVEVRWTPTGKGNDKGSLTIKGAALKSPQVVNLSGVVI